MDIEVSIPLEEALDLGWRTLAECFRPEQLLMKQELVDKYFPMELSAASLPPAEGTPEDSREAEPHGEAAAQ